MAAKVQSSTPYCPPSPMVQTWKPIGTTGLAWVIPGIASSGSCTETPSLVGQWLPGVLRATQERPAPTKVVTFLSLGGSAAQWYVLILHMWNPEFNLQRKHHKPNEGTAFINKCCCFFSCPGDYQPLAKSTDLHWFDPKACYLKVSRENKFLFLKQRRRHKWHS